MPPKQSAPFSYNVSRILDCGFYLEEMIEPEIGKIQVGYGLSFLFDVPNNWIQYIIKAEFKHRDGRVIAGGSVLTRFSIENLSDFIDDTDGDNIIFPDKALETLFGISFSHLRAILTKNFAGSRFSHLILPIVNSVDLFNNLLNHNVNSFKQANGVFSEPTKKEIIEPANKKNINRKKSTK